MAAAEVTNTARDRRKNFRGMALLLYGLTFLRRKDKL